MAGNPGKRPMESEASASEEEAPQLILRRNRPLAMMSFLSGRNPNARIEVGSSSSGEGMRAILLNSAPPNEPAEASTSGRRAISRPRPLTPEEQEWTDESENSGLLMTDPSSWWLENNARYRFAEQLEVYYSIMEADGYWCRMPTALERIYRAPPEYIGVYVRQLQNGLRFPVHPFVIKVLNGYNISLAQLTPVSIKRVMTYLWVCLFYGLEPSVHCFRCTHRLAPNTQSSKWHGLGWWQIEDEKGYLTTYPNDSSDKFKQGQWIWVRAPSDESHPNYFGGPRYTRKPDPSMSSIGLDDFTEADRQQMKLFDRSSNPGATGRMTTVPTVWLPYCHYIFQEKMLAVVGLSRRYQGEVCEEKSGINYGVLGISQKREPITNTPVITAVKDRPLTLQPRKLEVVSAFEYLAQKPWYKKLDPFFLHSAEEEAAAPVAAAAPRGDIAHPPPLPSEPQREEGSDEENTEELFGP